MTGSGPYLRAEIFRSGEQLRVALNVDGHAPDGRIQNWIVQHVLIPLHSKIRISFNDLRNMSLKWLIPTIQRVVASQGAEGDYGHLRPVRFRCWIEPGAIATCNVHRRNNFFRQRRQCGFIRTASCQDIWESSAVPQTRLANLIFS